MDNILLTSLPDEENALYVLSSTNYNAFKGWRIKADVYADGSTWGSTIPSYLIVKEKDIKEVFDRDKEAFVCYTVTSKEST